MKINKKVWMKVHTYLSLFFLPAALIYAITGVGYIYELRGDAGAEISEFKLENPPKKGEEQAFILDLLAQHNLKIPSNTEVRDFRGNARMGNVYYEVMITKNRAGDPILRVTQRNLYGVAIAMHFSRGTKFDVGGFKFHFFDFIAMGFGLSLLIFYLSGLIVTSFCKRDRLVSFSVLGSGVLITALAMYFSV